MNVWGNDLRERFYDELKYNLKKGGEKGIITYGVPKNGETIKINGVVLYKILRISNSWGKRGIAVHKKLTDTAIKAIEGKRSEDKKGWIGCALTDENYGKLMFILSDLAAKIFNAKESGTMGKRVRRTSVEIKQGKLTIPKKKILKKKGYNQSFGSNYMIPEENDIPF